MFTKLPAKEGFVKGLEEAVIEAKSSYLTKVTKELMEDLSKDLADNVAEQLIPILRGLHPTIKVAVERDMLQNATIINTQLILRSY